MTEGMGQHWRRKWDRDARTDGWSPIMPGDYISRLRAAYRDEGPAPSPTQYGWVLEG